MEYKMEEKEAPGRGIVKLLADTYEEGKPEGESVGRWLFKLRDRQEKLRYLAAGNR